jgi:hypothetical protein
MQELLFLSSSIFFYLLLSSSYLTHLAESAPQSWLFTLEQNVHVAWQGKPCKLAHRSNFQVGPVLELLWADFLQIIGTCLFSTRV